MIRVDIRAPLDYGAETIRQKVSEKLNMPLGEDVECRLLRRSIVAEDTADIHYKLSVLLTLPQNLEIRFCI
jgi:hypothetical protein